MQCMEPQHRGTAPNEMTGPALLTGHRPDPDEPVLELSVACTGLAVMEEDRGEPNSFVVASYVTPPQTLWTEHARTEVVEGSREPVYLSSIAFFRDSAATTDDVDIDINGQTRVKLAVYHVEDRCRGTTPIMLGSALFRLEELLQDERRRLRLELRWAEGDVAPRGIAEGDVAPRGIAGNISVTAWPPAARLLGDAGGGGGTAPAAPVDESPAGEFAAAGAGGTTTTASAYASSLSEELRSLFGHTMSRAYRLPAAEVEGRGSRRHLRVLEQMSESVLSFHVPRQYVKLLLEEDAARLRELVELGGRGELLSPRWDDLRTRTVSRYRAAAPAYRETLSHLDGYRGPSFKASSLKADGKLEFVPTNLHVQRMRVREEEEGEDGPGCERTYHVITFGTPTAHCRGFENGGLRKLIQQQESEDAEEKKRGAYTYSPRDVVRAREIAGRIDALRAQVGDLAERLSGAANERSAGEMQRTLAALGEKTRQLATLCDCKLLASASRALHEARPGNDDDDDSEHVDLGDNRDGAPSLERSGDEWEKARSNVIESLERVVRRADQLLRKEDSLRDNTTTTQTDQQGDGRSTAEEEEAYLGEWSEALQPLLAALTVGVAATSDRARKSVAFLLLLTQQDTADTADLSPARYRRDVVFCQALAALVCGFVLQMRSHLLDGDGAAFLRQLRAVGLLAQFESLLSNYGDEPAMLEDMSVGVADLRRVTFEVARAATSDDVMPTVSGGRDGVNVRVPLPAAVFDALPRELLEDEEGTGTLLLIGVWPVLFSVGVNGREPAGGFDTSLQDDVNAESLSRLNAYHERFKELLLPEDRLLPRRSRSQTTTTTSLAELLRCLGQDVVGAGRGTPKNVDVLRRAAEACRRLGGARFTSCRSAKDRTAMSVTLEQCVVARSEHGMAGHVFARALDCMRSEGVRRELPLKNVGRRLYAFAAAQVPYLPELYRPPGGTFGKGET